MNSPLADLEASHAIHFGHSYLVVNVAGLRLALDPATETGYLAAPFSNLTHTAATPLKSYQPLVDPARLLPTAETLAPQIDAVLFSHLHADHFNAALLERMLRANPRLRVIWPAGAERLVSQPRPALRTCGRRLLAALNRCAWADNVPAAVQEYLETEPLELPAARVHAASAGSVGVLRAEPLVAVRAFEVRHPRPLLWVQLPWEAATPPVLGYEVLYEQAGKLRSVLLVGESSTDPEVLYQIWAGRERLVSVFAPADAMPAVPGLNWLYDHYIHASPRLLALAERLAGGHTSLHGLHHGLWLYTLTEAAVEAERQRLQHRLPEPAAQPADLPAALWASRGARQLSLTGIRRFQALAAQLRELRPAAGPRIRFQPLGQAFALGA